jgi:uncharacterized protein YutE (UPF0331/DUF86 family)
MIDKKLIEKKLRNIEDLLREIRSEKEINNYEEFISNIVFKRFIERNFELAIEKMLDICKHLVSKLNLREPETYSNCLEIIAEEGIIPKETEDIFKSMVKYRNLLIHAYEKIDDNITYGIYKRHLPDFEKFIEVIRDYLKIN